MTCQSHLSPVNQFRDYWVPPNSINRTDAITTRFLPCPSFLLPPCTPWSLDLPEVIVDGQSIYADWHRLGGDDCELLAVWAVFVQLVDHLLVNSTRSCPCELDNLLGVWWVRVDGTELTPTVTEENDQMIGLALFQLLRWVKHAQNLICEYWKT